MKYTVTNIMTKLVYTINLEDGVRKAERIMDDKGIGCLPVYDNGQLVGIITSKDIRKAHPNRIVADAMTKNIVSIKPETTIWEAHEILIEKNIERLLVLDGENLVGVITQADLLTEIGKHIDLLTGLYKSEYISNKISKLLMNDVEVSIIFIDLNKFGLIDKKYGHVIGDIIIKEVSVILIENSPEEVQISRYGGDEFVILTPFCIDKCKLFAEELLNLIAMHVFYNGIKVNASAGITCRTLIKSKQSSPLLHARTLINLASLASTKAKKENSGIIVAKNVSTTEIA